MLCDRTRPVWNSSTAQMLDEIDAALRPRLYDACADWNAGSLSAFLMEKRKQLNERGPYGTTPPAYFAQVKYVNINRREDITPRGC